MSTTKTSPSWKRPISERLKASFGSNPLPPPQTLPSQLPTADQQIRLNLEDTTLIFDNGRWITGLYLFQSSSLSLSIHLLNFSQCTTRSTTRITGSTQRMKRCAAYHTQHTTSLPTISSFFLILIFLHLSPALSHISNR